MGGRSDACLPCHTAPRAKELCAQVAGRERVGWWWWWWLGWKGLDNPAPAYAAAYAVSLPVRIHSGLVSPGAAGSRGLDLRGHHPPHASRLFPRERAGGRRRRVGAGAPRWMRRRRRRPSRSEEPRRSVCWDAGLSLARRAAVRIFRIKSLSLPDQVSFSLCPSHCLSVCLSARRAAVRIFRSSSEPTSSPACPSQLGGVRWVVPH